MRQSGGELIASGALHHPQHQRGRRITLASEREIAALRLLLNLKKRGFNGSVLGGGLSETGF